jgi:predicted metal-dependent hydrolase
VKVRYPQLDFSKVRPHWAPNIEFAQRANASGLIPTHVEPYLVKVMLKAKPLIDARNTRLHADVAVFCKQEAQHCKQHNAFNLRLREAGYDDLAAMEQALSDDLERFLAHRSLKFNLAYSDGFEAMGAFGAQLWFDCYVEYLDGADAEAVDLWRWHMAEEYEHREVAFSVYHELYGRKNLFEGWIYRVYGFLYAARHLMGFGNRAAAYLLAQDRKAMTPEERALSIARERAFRKKMAKFAIPELLKVLSPFYDPAKRTAPPEVAAYLIRFEPAASQA